MHNNVAFGTTSNAAAGPSGAAPSGAAAAPEAAPSSPEQAASAAQPADAQWQVARAARERFECAQQPGAVEHSEPGLPDSGPPGHRPDMPSLSSMSDGAPLSDSNAEPASLQPARAQALTDISAAPPTERTAAANVAAQAQDAAVSEPSSLSKAPHLPAGGAKRTTQDAAAAARERYLARKRKAPNDAAVS